MPENKRKLDCRPQLSDHRDFLLADFMDPSLATTGDKQWAVRPEHLDQGQEGACVGFGWTGFLNCEPVEHDYQNAYAFRLYDRCTVVDDIPGTWKTGQEGTDVRVGAKVVQSRGHIQSYAFASSIEEVMTWLLNNGPVVVGIPWLNSMDNPQGENGYCYVEPSSGVRGWHCVYLSGVSRHGRSSDFVRFENSWSDAWGASGGGRFAAKGLGVLLNTDGAVAVTACEVK